MRSFFFWLPFTVTGKLLGKRENSLITILSAFKYSSNWLWHFPFSNVLFLLLYFNYSPIKVNQFEGHFMKLQADSNYLLSKEYEVQLRRSDALAPWSLAAFPSQPVLWNHGLTGLKSLDDT